MSIYVLILLMKVTMLPLHTPQGVSVDTLVTGEVVYTRSMLVSGPRQAAVEVLQANPWHVPGNEKWEGRLFRVDLEPDRRVWAMRVPVIRSASDTLSIQSER
jgi:hypothetical protein